MEKYVSYTYPLTVMTIWFFTLKSVKPWSYYYLGPADFIWYFIKLEWILLALAKVCALLNTILITAMLHTVYQKTYVRSLMQDCKSKRMICV